MTILGYCLLGLMLVLLGGSLWAWLRGRYLPALVLLMGSSFCLRVFMAQLDPFLHDWDERFHALVAKNMISAPLAPMLRANPIFPYDYKSWCCNHIWLHKQPLFLWQMAFSMGLFGSNELAMRLPSTLLSTLLLYPVYRIGYLVFNQETGYIGAVLVAFAYYGLELVSGAIGMDHNDIAFMSYVTASIWAYYEYRYSSHPWRWVVLVGVLAGAAVLCKWLTGLIVYAGWGVASLVLTKGRQRWSELVRLGVSVLVAAVVFMPWQLYTAWRFPLESSFERAYNTRHFSEALEGHDYSWSYHLKLLPVHYGFVLPLIIIGLIMTASKRGRAALPLLVIIGVIYTFFSVAATKMYSYTYVISPLLLLLAAVPLAALRQWRPSYSFKAALVQVVGLSGLIVLDARPWGIVQYHMQERIYGIFNEPLHRRRRIANTKIARTLDTSLPTRYIVFNARGLELDAMFYSSHEVYNIIPDASQLEYIRRKGLGIATFSGTPGYPLPHHLATFPGIVLLWASPE